MLDKYTKFLIVGDTLTRVIVKGLLVKVGYSLTEGAETGEVAVRMARSGAFGMVISNVALKGTVDGVALLREVRAVPTLSNVPVLLLAQKSISAETELAKHPDADAVVLRPINEELFSKAVFDAMAKRVPPVAPIPAPAAPALTLVPAPAPVAAKRPASVAKKPTAAPKARKTVAAPAAPARRPATTSKVVGKPIPR